MFNVYIYTIHITYSYNIHTFVSCGVGYRFIQNDTYRIELTIYDTDGASYTLENELDIGNTIDWQVSLTDAQSPWQGMYIENAILNGDDFNGPDLSDGLRRVFDGLLVGGEEGCFIERLKNIIPKRFFFS